MATGTLPTPSSLLVVDDEPELRGLLGEYFARHGYTVLAAQDAREARQIIAQAPPDLAILDINMPGETGLSLARWLREAHPGVAIVMLTTAGEAIDRIVGLELGADDYVGKPFELRELLAADGSEIEITAAEFDLLALFARHPNRPLSRDQIMEQAHNRGWDVFDRSIDLRVMRLRRKIERNADKPEVIKTVRNVGYVFVPAVQ